MIVATNFMLHFLREFIMHGELGIVNRVKYLGRAWLVMIGSHPLLLITPLRPPIEHPNCQHHRRDAKSGPNKRGNDQKGN